jgi:hypothetical protein
MLDVTKKRAGQERSPAAKNPAQKQRQIVLVFQGGARRHERRQAP